MNTGDNIKINLLELIRLTLSLEKSLIASLKGWKIPKIPTLEGPFRVWT